MASTRASATLLQNNGRDDNRTIYTDSVIPNVENNLSNWLIRLEITNTGISAVNTGMLTLRIDDIGTFVRTGPILVDENTKNNFLIELQLKQDLAGDGNFSSEGIIVRGIIGAPTITINQAMGEILKIPITSLQYHLKEQVSSRWLLFKTPNEAFQSRVDEISGAKNGFLRTTSITNNLPTRPQLTYKPSGPSILYDEMANIIDGLSNPQVTGGSFDDFYFDIEPTATYTNHINITADVFGTIDSGVVIDPISLEPQDTDEENTTITDNIVYKNNVIMIGSPNGGSLPVDRTRFASNFEHAKIRDFWAIGQSYKEGDLVKLETPTPSSLKPFLITYHKALIDHTSSNTNNPMTNHGTTWEVDFTDVPPYISGAYYSKGEIISVQSGSNLSFYQANNGGTHLTPSNSNWNLILIKPLPTRNSGVLAGVTASNYSVFITYTPWTNNIDVWKETLAGKAFAPSGFEGWAWDWNVTKANYNRQDMTNHYEPISAKVVTSMTRTSNTNVTTDRRNYDGNRYVVPSSGTVGSWVGKGKYVAEWDESMTGSERWQFSNAPVDSDVVIDLETARIFRYNGTSNLWGTIWDPLDSNDNDKPAPFHLVKNVGLIAGATGIAGQAIQFTYDWSVNDSSSSFPKRTSRGLWICNSTLLPRLDTTSVNTGGLYGGDGTNSPPSGTIDTNNLDLNSKGLRGWNRGIDDEDFGKLSTLTFKIKASMYADVAGTNLVEGVPEIPLTFWAIDKFDRVWFKKFKARRNGQWDEVKIPVGEMAQNNLYFARWDELSLLLDGVPLTEWDFTLKEKEFSGVNFDWKYMKWWGIQLNEANVDSGLYKNGHQRAFEFGEDVLADLSANWYWYMLGPLGTAIKRALPRHTPITQNLIRNSAKIALDDLHFEKEQMVTSDDTTITKPRTSIEYVAQESDYLNLKSRAIASQARKRFFPQTTHIRSTGDVRLRFGKHFKVKGSRVLENPTNLIAWSNGNNYSINSKVSYNGYAYQALKASTSSTPKQPDTNSDYWENLNKYSISTVRHLFDHDGYHCEIAGFRKFVVSG